MLIAADMSLRGLAADLNMAPEDPRVARMRDLLVQHHPGGDTDAMWRDPRMQVRWLALWDEAIGWTTPATGAAHTAEPTPPARSATPTTRVTEGAQMSLDLWITSSRDGSTSR